MPRHFEELGDSVCIVNSDSRPFSINIESVHIIEAGSNVGFAAGCNRGIEFGIDLGASHFIIINPDVYLPPSWLSRVKEAIFDNQYADAGAFTTPLLGYSFDKDQPSGEIDSMGVAHTWYGRWYDISQGQPAPPIDLSAKPYDIEACCGALMVLTRDAVDALINDTGFVFDQSYFMYKEDIELSLHLKSLGKRIMVIPNTFAYHCRGWQKNRTATPFWARSMSAKNELRLHRVYYKKFLPYSLMKYLYVQSYERLRWRLSNR